MWDFFYYERELIYYLCDFFIVKSKFPHKKRKPKSFATKNINRIKKIIIIDMGKLHQLKVLNFSFN